MYDIFAKLLELNNLKAADVCRATGLPSSLFSEWKRGKSTPKADKMQIIADFFCVSIEYLMTGEAKNNTEHYYYSKYTLQAAQDIFQNKELRTLFNVARNSATADLNIVLAVLLALKRKERGDDDSRC